MSNFKTIAEMDRIRSINEKVRAAEIAAFIPEKNESKSVAFFEIARYTTGQFKGLFLVYQILVEEKGKALKHPIKKPLVEGVDMVVAMSYLETALRKRVFR